MSVPSNTRSRICICLLTYLNFPSNSESHRLPDLIFEFDSVSDQRACNLIFILAVLAAGRFRSCSAFFFATQVWHLKMPCFLLAIVYARLCSPQPGHGFYNGQSSPLTFSFPLLSRSTSLAGFRQS